MRLKFQERSELKLVSRINPRSEATWDLRFAENESRRVGMKLEALIELSCAA